MEIVDAARILADSDRDPQLIVDPRRPVKYLQGHLKNAVNVPATKAFDSNGALRREDELAAWLGRQGIASDSPVLIYDDADGRDGAMLAWILEYLGHPRLRFMREPFGRWPDLGGELYYRPLQAPPAEFHARPRRQLRATRKDVARAIANDAGASLLDTRTREEFDGEVEVQGRGGHLPGAVHLPWQAFRQGDELFPAGEEVADLLAAAEASVLPDRPLIAYCMRGPRAAVATMALRLRGYDARLYDGSFADWVQDPDSPVER